MAARSSGVARVAAEEKTQIGLPEVLLGIIPGFGGTARLPRLVGLSAALDLILTGRTLDAKRAEKLGVIAKAAPAAWLLEAAEQRLGEIARRPAGRRRDAFRPRDAAQRLLDAKIFGRAIVFQQARAGVLRRTGGHYPAPQAAVETIERGLDLTVDRALLYEENAVVPLVVGPVCKNLVRVFHLSEDAKRKSPVEDESVRPAPIARLALAGAGVMGGGIAELASRFGLQVRLRDVRPEALQKGLQTVRAVLGERGRRQRTSAREQDGQMARILPTLELTGVSNADLAIEAVIEDLDVKRRVFGELEVRMRADAVLDARLRPVQADPDQMTRVLRNLILNAIDAMPQGGTLTVRTSALEGGVRLEVSDTGQGLTPEESSRLFTPYYTTKAHGTGLGLAIVQSVVSDHHGRISVESAPGKGATFRIELG